MFCFNFGTESWNWKIQNWKLWHTFKPPICTYSSGFSYGDNFSLEPNSILQYSYREVCMGLLPALGNVGFSEDVLSYMVHVTIPRRKHLTWRRSRLQALVVQGKNKTEHCCVEQYIPPPPRQFRGIETAKVLNWIPRYWRVYIDTTSFLVTVWKHFDHILLKLHLYQMVFMLNTCIQSECPE